jgi:hypothetical protein
LSAVVIAIISTIVVGAILTIALCALLARLLQAELSALVGVVGIVVTIVFAVLAQPFAWWWEERLPSAPISPPSPPAHTPAASPVVADCKFHPDQEVPVSIGLRTTDRAHTQSYEQNGSYHLMFEPSLTWAGYLISLPEGVCDYRLELTAQLLPDSRPRVLGEGWGYGIGPCNVWTADAPRGFALQYAGYQQSPTQVINNPSRVVNPDVNSGVRVPVPSLDNSEHQWVFSVRGGVVAVTEDFGQDIGSYPVAGSQPLPATCHGRDIFIRVFNASVIFTDIRVVAQ